MKVKSIPVSVRADYKAVVDHCTATGEEWVAPTDINLGAARASLRRYGFGAYELRDEAGSLIGYTICTLRA